MGGAVLRSGGPRGGGRRRRPRGGSWTSTRVRWCATGPPRTRTWPGRWASRRRRTRVALPLRSTRSGSCRAGSRSTGSCSAPRPARVRFGTRSHHVHVLVDGREVVTGPATTVVIANGEFFDGLDIVPRGHPGDGRLEVQVYALRRGERRAMRSRLPRGIHVPHPRITTATGGDGRDPRRSGAPGPRHRRGPPRVGSGPDGRGHPGSASPPPVIRRADVLRSPRRIPAPLDGCQYPRRSDAVRGGALHLGRTGHPAPVLHERRRPGVRPRELARGGEGSVVRATRVRTRASVDSSSTSSSARSTSRVT